jgi:threonyl-tRNA synthetase
MDRSLWEKSGHWDNYRENMFTTESEEPRLRGQADELPGPRADLQQGPEELPRPAAALAEFGSCHRNEPSGALHGLMRVRAFTQDDAHIFCTEDQMQSEVAEFIAAARSMPISASAMSSSSCPPARPSGSAATPIWDKAEQALWRRR